LKLSIIQGRHSHHLIDAQGAETRPKEEHRLYWERALEEVRSPKTRPLPPLIGLMLQQKPDQEEDDPE
jgi:hypothetical protein